MRFLKTFVLSIVAASVGLGSASAQSFEVATIKRTPPDWRGGRFATMQSAHQFVARNYTVKYMIAAAYNLPMQAVSGGPNWMDTDPYDIQAGTPGEQRPTTDEQWAMLRTLLRDRFKLVIHRESREMPVYALTLAKDGSKLKESLAPADQTPVVVNQVFPDHIELPARNSTMPLFASVLQRAVLDRPVLDRTGLPARYDFDLAWTPDETQFGGAIRPVTPDGAPKPDLYAAIQQQLGLRLESTRGRVDVVVVDSVERPSEN